MINVLRRKFILVNMICVTLILAVVFTSIYLIQSRQLKQESRDTLEQALIFSSRHVSMQLDINNDIIEEYQDGLEPASFVVFVGYDNKYTILDYNMAITEDKMTEAVNAVIENKNEGDILTKYNLRYMINEENDGIKIAFLDLASERTERKNLVLTCLIAGFVAMCGFFLMSLFLSKWALRPVEKAWNSQKQFAADASHELKTPLTVILANMDILRLHKADSIEDRIEWVNNTRAEAERMKELADNLLYLTKSGDLRTPQIMEKVNLSDVITKTALAFEPLAFEHKISIETFVDGDIFINGDGSQMKQLTAILIDNAVKYSFEKTNIKVSLKEQSGKAILKVNNIGVPIAKDDLTNIFERFYRSDESRSEDGYGLGLSIAKNITEQHKGQIVAASNDKDGSTFTVILPLYKV